MFRRKNTEAESASLPDLPPPDFNSMALFVLLKYTGKSWNGPIHKGVPVICEGEYAYTLRQDTANQLNLDKAAAALEMLVGEGNVKRIKGHKNLYVLCRTMDEICATQNNVIDTDMCRKIVGKFVIPQDILNAKNAAQSKKRTGSVDSDPDFTPVDNPFADDYRPKKIIPISGSSDGLGVDDSSTYQGEIVTSEGLLRQLNGAKWDLVKRFGVSTKHASSVNTVVDIPQDAYRLSFPAGQSDYERREMRGKIAAQLKDDISKDDNSIMILSTALEHYRPHAEFLKTLRDLTGMLWKIESNDYGMPSGAYKPVLAKAQVSDVAELLRLLRSISSSPKYPSAADIQKLKTHLPMKHSITNDDMLNMVMAVSGGADAELLQQFKVQFLKWQEVQDKKLYKNLQAHFLAGVHNDDGRITVTQQAIAQYHHMQSYAHRLDEITGGDHTNPKRHHWEPIVRGHDSEGDESRHPAFMLVLPEGMRLENRDNAYEKLSSALGMDVFKHPRHLDENTILIWSDVVLDHFHRPFGSPIRDESPLGLASAFDLEPLPAAERDGATYWVNKAESATAAPHKRVADMSSSDSGIRVAG